MSHRPQRAETTTAIILPQNWKQSTGPSADDLNSRRYRSLACRGLPSPFAVRSLSIAPRIGRFVTAEPERPATAATTNRANGTSRSRYEDASVFIYLPVTRTSSLAARAPTRADSVPMGGDARSQPQSAASVVSPCLAQSPIPSRLVRTENSSITKADPGTGIHRLCRPPAAQPVLTGESEGAEEVSARTVINSR